MKTIMKCFTLLWNNKSWNYKPITNQFRDKQNNNMGNTKQAVVYNCRTMSITMIIKLRRNSDPKEFNVYVLIREKHFAILYNTIHVFIVCH